MSFKILHKPTGFFYCPSRNIKNYDGHYVKSNLSKKGKSYRKSPALGCIGEKIATHLHSNKKNTYIDAPLHDWQIIKEGVTDNPDLNKALSFDEYASKIGEREFLKQLRGSSDLLSCTSSEETAFEIMADCFRVGLAAFEKAKQSFRLNGVL